jgi:haloacetate dehalogenase
VVSGGQGPPVLLLHGNPQTHVMWHKIAAPLAREFTVVAADLRGYGDSSKPADGENHANYSKRAMALDQVEVMSHFGFEKFTVVDTTAERALVIGWRSTTPTGSLSWW